MNKTIRPKLDKETGDYFIDIKEFENVIDIKKAVSFYMKHKKDGSIHLTFYDKYGKIIKTKE